MSNSNLFNDCFTQLESYKIKIFQKDSWSETIKFNKKYDSISRNFEIYKIRLTSDELNILRTFDLVKPKWDVYWDYIFLAENHFYEENYRMALIELDIALDIVIKRYIQNKLSLEDEVFNNLNKDNSTGDLLKVAKFISDNNEAQIIENLKNLHNVRNTILHRYQRNISTEHIELYKTCKESLLKLI